MTIIVDLDTEEQGSDPQLAVKVIADDLNHYSDAKVVHYCVRKEDPPVLCPECSEPLEA